MGYQISLQEAEELMQSVSKQYAFYAPKVFLGSGCFSDTDTIRYGEVHRVEEIVFDRKSDYSFKEILLPISQTLFYFTEDVIREPAAPKKVPVILVRSCDMHAVRRMDEIYLRNGFEDHYYRQLREHAIFVVMGCAHAFDSCFCVDMECNQVENYDYYLHLENEQLVIDSKKEIACLKDAKQIAVEPLFVKETKTKVHIPDKMTGDIKTALLWEEYTKRCIGCGRCNFVCPTCTCFTMQDIFYKDNGKVGERRRVWASCQVDGFTTIAGGISFRKKQGERMRYKVMHKIFDFKERHGYQMCVGCGRCDDICPEYISFSNCVNKLDRMIKEEKQNEE